MTDTVRQFTEPNPKDRCRSCCVSDHEQCTCISTIIQTPRNAVPRIRRGPRTRRFPIGIHVGRRKTSSVPPLSPPGNPRRFLPRGAWCVPLGSQRIPIPLAQSIQLTPRAPLSLKRLTGSLSPQASWCPRS
ncbi:hypothetical protein SJAG_05872 [Schizosaccharomyces japonicus yFS275]|uniref:Uncharacterized protein n=1 Tax=Schizosaccharomyces japonicus (strain yFS275 / FY16936) TaxID=402676 RepID=T0S346_SCHJY|nr:hypothetical protein SJAG_05872 [Schizosaccharomyces japonicus yFS275]EQC53046.1 hypothetical protein SJAG_05872 [Schizosaccharomyces japonicus yFS275]